jgi:CheY-like chemotaxis protein
VEGDDRLPSTAMFKSPVIIVALTASSLQSDRHEALAAGCNDFLTKVRHPLLSFLIYKANNPQASQLRLARTQGNGMGLHASTD